MKKEDIVYTLICDLDGKNVVRTLTNISNVRFTTAYKGQKEYDMDKQEFIYVMDENEDLDSILDQILFIESDGEFGYLFTISRKEVSELKELYHKRLESTDESESTMLAYVLKHSAGGIRVKMIQDKEIIRKSVVPYIV